MINKQMSATRRRILILLKEKGDLTAAQLAEFLSISTVAVRRHLNRLEGDQLVRYNEVQRGMGRPSFIYQLGEAADDFFPRSYEKLASTVIETIRELYGREAIDAIFQVRTGHILKNYRHQVNGKTLDERLEQLTKLREADGYMSSWEKVGDGSFILRESNCPIIHVAKDCNSACNYDVVLLKNLLEADVVRVAHLINGDDACCYEIRPRVE